MNHELSRKLGAFYSKTAVAWSTILFLCLFNVMKSIHCHQQLACVDSYWADFWLISYSDGYERRALIGSFLRSLGFRQLGSSGLNLAALALVIFNLSALFLLSRSYFSGDRQKNLLAATFVVGPTLTVFFEVLGDPLQVSLAVTLTFIFLSSYAKGGL